MCLKYKMTFSTTYVYWAPFLDVALQCVHWDKLISQASTFLSCLDLIEHLVSSSLVPSLLFIFIFYDVCIYQENLVFKSPFKQKMLRPMFITPVQISTIIHVNTGLMPLNVGELLLKVLLQKKILSLLVSSPKQRCQDRRDSPRYYNVPRWIKASLKSLGKSQKALLKVSVILE